MTREFWRTKFPGVRCLCSRDPIQYVDGYGMPNTISARFFDIKYYFEPVFDKNEWISTFGLAMMFFDNIAIFDTMAIKVVVFDFGEALFD